MKMEDPTARPMQTQRALNIHLGSGTGGATTAIASRQCTAQPVCAVCASEPW